MFNSGKDGFAQSSEFDSDVSGFGGKRDSVTDIIADIGASIGKFLESIKIKISFDKYMQVTSEVIDKKIIEICQAENLSYVGGSCIFNISPDKKYLVAKMELFFRNAVGEWIKKEQGFTAKTNVFNEEAHKGVLKDILRNGLKVDISAPETGR